MSGNCDFEVCIIGSGPTGLFSAAMFAQIGVNTALVSPKIDVKDGRTTALWHSSVKTFESLNVWEVLKEDATPISKIRLLDDTSRLIRAPELTFDCSEIELDAFGYNILNQDLIQNLNVFCGKLKNITRIESKVVLLNSDDQSIKIHLENNQEIACQLCVGADGRNSVVRDFIGSEISQRDYGQSAMVLNLKHSIPHQNISTEFHTSNGPFTLVPLGGEVSSLVCVDNPREIERLIELEDSVLEKELEARSKSILGKFAVTSDKQVFPISRTLVKKLATNRSVLVGDSAHGLPPIGAQGLNLGVRDVASLGEYIVQAKSVNQDLGSRKILADFERARKVDVQMRSVAVDMLNRSLLTGFLPTQVLRHVGAQIANKIPAVRKKLMKLGAFDSFAVPKLEQAMLSKSQIS